MAMLGTEEHLINVRHKELVGVKYEQHTDVKKASRAYVTKTQRRKDEVKRINAAFKKAKGN